MVLMFLKENMAKHLDFFNQLSIITKKGVIFLKSIEKITVTDISSIATIAFPKGVVTNISNRESFGLSLCLEGQLTYSHNGRDVVSDKNSIVFLPKGESYSIRGEKAGMFPLINFFCDEDFCDTVVSIPIKNAQPYLADFEKIKALSLFEKNRLKIMSVFYGMLQRISSETTRSYGVLAPAIKLIEEECFEREVTIATLAEKCNMSEVYFRRLFLSRMGVPPKQYLIDVRIEKAKQLLADGVLKVNAIAEECGFSNPYHFSRIFRQKTGQTPTEYMKQNKVYEI